MSNNIIAKLYRKQKFSTIHIVQSVLGTLCVHVHFCTVCTYVLTSVLSVHVHMYIHRWHHYGRQIQADSGSLREDQMHSSCKSGLCLLCCTDIASTATSGRISGA